MQLYVDGIGVWTPGLADWSEARAVLRGELPYQPTSMALPAASLLHATERRRAPATVKLAVQVAQSACTMAEADPAALPCVFASSHGDTEISDYMCAELAQPLPSLSPTRFHNSVHNAASGYWTIAVGCMQPANAISAGMNSFGSGLIEAAAMLANDAEQVLLVAYDITAPAALLPLCPISQSFGIALLLSRRQSLRSLARLQTGGGKISTTEHAQNLPQFALQLMAANPAARSLPLLYVLANDIATRVSFASVAWDVSACR